MSYRRKRISALSLPKASSRLGIIKLVETKVIQLDFEVIGRQEGRDIVIPVNIINGLILGYGTSITHDAALTLSNAGVIIIWETAGRITGYSTSLPQGKRSDLLQKHVSVWSNDSEKLLAAKRAYKIRFKDDDLSYITSFEKIRQLEGARVKKTYLDKSLKYGIKWDKRITDWEHSDELNKCITISYQYLYGYAYSAIALTGCHPALGFIHTGHRFAFAYDIADILKTDIGLDSAFEAFIQGGHLNVGSILNNKMKNMNGIEIMVKSICQILGNKEILGVEEILPDLRLWNGIGNNEVPAGIDYDNLLEDDE